jgi:hypothetical protein
MAGLGPLQTVAVLGFALVAPAALPAGGADCRSVEVRRRQSREPLLAAGSLDLRCAPEQQAPVLTRLPSGEPLQVLRRWRSPRGRQWLQVQTTPGDGAAGRKGWIAAL